MRVLHQVAPEEIPVAAGQYQYLVDGEPNGQIETWQITRLADGSEIVRADIDGRKTESQANLVSHLLRHPEGIPKWLRIRYSTTEVTAAAHYSFKEAGVRVFRQAEGYSRREDTLDIATGYEVDYHAVIAHDYVWRGYPEHAHGQRWAIPIFSPEMWPQSPENLLTGRSLRFSVYPAGVESCETPIGTFEEARSYEIRLSDGVTAAAWFDEFGIPLRWVYPEKKYDFVLISYKRD